MRTLALVCLFCTSPLLPVGAAENEPAPSAVASQSWSQWRGPHRDSKLQGPAWPSKLQGRLEQQWKVEFGPSYSGPIVTANKIFTTETLDRKFEVVRALDRATGKQLWETRWEGAMSVPFFAKANGDWIRATPAYDGKRLYVAGMRDVLVCIDAETGEQIWTVDFVSKLKSAVPAFGFASSPMVLGDFVYVQAGGGFVKLDKKTGEMQWRALSDGGGMFGSAFSSPFLAELGGIPQILVQTRTALSGVDPESGTMLWKQDVPAFRGMNILTPTVINDTVFTSAYGGRAFLFRPVKEGEKWTVEESWANKVQAYMSSPVVINGHIYVHLRNQRFACIDAATGKEKYITKPFGKYWSMVANGDQILALDERGDLLLIKANPEEFELLDQQKVAENSWAHLAVSGNHVVVRDLNALTVYTWK